MGEWISVKDRLPEVGVNVLIWDSFWEQPIISFLYADMSGFGGEATDATHWQPLPGAPK